VSGVDFRTAWAKRVRTKIDGVALCFIGRDELIKNKLASGRAKDIADLALLAEAEAPVAKRTKR
jgi:hypothetical protein